ncbi:hypothetical protein ACVWYW_003793 [Ewingella americana]|uniref:Uncharacterized protein n=1 Tax=Ewingella americana TaxID=41202 RepID=A0A377N6C5_9GAMM|nr:Uncharacterised protein [Ewingella americana]
MLVIAFASDLHIVKFIKERIHVVGLPLYYRAVVYKLPNCH